MNLSLNDFNRTNVGFSNGPLLTPRVVLPAVGSGQLSGLRSILANHFLFSPILSKKASDSVPLLGFDMRVGYAMGGNDHDVLLPTGSEEISRLVMPDISRGGAHLCMGAPLVFETPPNQSLVIKSPSSILAEAPSLTSIREGKIDMSFQARHEDITINDIEEALSLDSPVSEYSDCSDRVDKEMSVDEGGSNSVVLSSKICCRIPPVLYQMRKI